MPMHQLAVLVMVICGGEHWLAYVIRLAGKTECGGGFADYPTERVLRRRVTKSTRLR